MVVPYGDQPRRRKGQGTVRSPDKYNLLGIRAALESDEQEVEFTRAELLALVEAAEALRDLCRTDPSMRHNRPQDPGWAHGRAHLRAEAALERFNFA